MNNHIKKLIERYNYQFPKELIAQEPASPRDSAQLLIYNQKNHSIKFDNFFNLTKYLPHGSILVFNETEVIPARLVLRKETGGKVKALFIEESHELVKVMADRKLIPLSKLFINKKLFFTVQKQEEKFYLLQPSFNLRILSQILEKYGETPIPPYIKNTPLKEGELREKYQTIFAKTKGSVAAPTASLHFTKRLFKKIKTQGFGVEFITLHVGLGTFAPLEEGNFKLGRLHEEKYFIDPRVACALNHAKKIGRPIIAVGTTTARTLESASLKNGKLKNLNGATDLFIREGYRFSFIDGLITNFHVPHSSLLMLVSALVGRERLLELYKTAIRKKFRLFSFGDGMLIY
ncbi:MAG: tRNA preQ1(34) S-adenosylmethionine ribosyltransferase-isomerase QueA [Patescibacteria group bacterium]